MNASRCSRGGAGCLVMFLLVTACGERGGATRAADAIVRDSAGIIIVESVAPAWAAGEGLSISETPILTIGMQEGPPEYQLHQVRAAVRLPDGRIAMTNGGTAELRIYGPDGRHLVSAGGSGGGPGEFVAIADAMPAGDSIQVWDAATQRISVFGMDGGFGRTSVVGSDPGLPMLGGFLADGSLVLGHFDPFGRSRLQDQPPVRQRPEIVYTRRTSDGTVTDTIGRLPGPEMMMQSSVLFSPFTHVAARGDRIVSGDGERYEIEYRAPDGELLRIARIPHTPERVTEEHLLSAIAQAPLERMSHAVDVRDLLHAEYFPAYGGLMVDATGHVWALEFPRPGHQGPRGMDVFDPDGYWLGTLSMSPSFRALDIGEDYILGMWRDEFDVEYLHLYQLTRG
jgi:hypothetical protein